MKKLLVFLLCLLLLPLPAAQARTLKLLVIGNSFSGNATKYLPQLAREGGHTLVIGRAERGGHSLQQHWSYVESNQANPDDPKGKLYGGKSLGELLESEKWDVVTMQQYSLLSGDVATYRPYAQKLSDFIKARAPQAEIMLHQTWAYRSDAKNFGYTEGQQRAQNQREMWEKSRAAYSTIARELGISLIQVGDAFEKINSDADWQYHADPNFDFANPVYPALPDQTHSLNAGYSWSQQTKLNFDANHANAAGCYLGALVWYGVLFGESPQKLTFVPPGVAADFSAELRSVAAEVLQEK